VRKTTMFERSVTQSIEDPVWAAAGALLALVTKL
jgi:hypothetical protein